MLDIKRIRENLDDIKKAMERRGEREFDLDAVVELDNKRREILQEVEVMKNELNQYIKKKKKLSMKRSKLK
ncbi:UNVERIFIED_ORG: seryl-tRNA synthetase N-terminal domain protein, partial [Clostridioides difficile Y384]